jgi:hypothetical protein
MNNNAMKWILAGAIGVSLAAAASVQAQSTLGGAKPQQNKIGGVAKPAPVIGGANTDAPAPNSLKSGPVANVAKPSTSTPGSPGTSTPSGPTISNTRPNPQPIQGKGTSVANLKCSGGACTSKGPRP